MPSRVIRYAQQQIAMKNNTRTNYTALHGVQSFSKNLAFNITNAFEFAQVAPYALLEGSPVVECQISKVLDGYPLLWTMATLDATDPTLLGRSTSSSMIALSLYADTSSSASGTGTTEAIISGLFPTSIQYQFPVDGNFTESLNLSGTDITWRNPSINGSFSGNNDAPIGTGGINRRQHIKFTTSETATDSNGQIEDKDCTILPPDVAGIAADGVNVIDSNGNPTAVINNISVSATLNREELLGLGKQGPITRILQLPVEVTTEITAVAGSGDLINASSTQSSCSSVANTTNRTIRIATCEGTRIYLGKKNKLTSVNYGGGDTGGGNVNLTYSYVTYNHLTVMHSSDVATGSGSSATMGHPSGSTWWTNRADYLT